METLRVNLKENSYDIKFTDSFSSLSDSLLEIKAPKKILIVTDSNVNRLYESEVKAILDNSGYDTDVFTFHQGEEHKNIDTILGICRACMKHKMDRTGMIAALGGGVVGDMAGFAAAIYMRGIRFIQIPTTLLSQSDSSVGGKTGIDFDGGKNILGSFHQPGLVYINVNTLKTLPEEQFISGMGEVIKHSLIHDGDFFEYLHKNMLKIKSFDKEALIYMAKTNCGIKADIVAQDERESGLRAILNYGHTIGHAVESASNFNKTHGACVGLGIVGASFIAKQRGLITEKFLCETEQLLQKYGIDTHTQIPDNSVISDFMLKDKKRQNGRQKFILPIKKGEVIQTEDVTNTELNNALEYIRR